MAESTEGVYKVPLGMDFGTCHTCITVIPKGSSVPVTIKDETGRSLHSSAIYYDVDPNKPNLYGTAALNMLPNDNVITCVKRCMGINSSRIIKNKLQLSFNAKMVGNGNAFPKFSIKRKDDQGIVRDVNVTAQQVATDLLKHYKSIVETEVGSNVGYVVSMPEHWLSSSVGVLKSALASAGIKPLQLITEPAGTQFAYRAVTDSEKKVFLVVDLGDGTLDTSLLKEESKGYYTTKVVGGSEVFGSRDVDHILLEKLEEELRLDPTFNEESFQDQKPTLLVKMKELKHKLSQNEDATEIVYGVTVKGFHFKVNRDKKKNILSNFYKKFGDIINDMFVKKAETCKQYTAQDMKDSVDIVYMAGGGMCDPVYGEDIIPLILPNAEIVGKRGSVGAINPFEVVSNGACYWAASQMMVPLRFGLPMEAVHQRVLSRSLGVEGVTYSETNTEIKWFNVLLHANTEIPTSKIRRYTTCVQNQPNIVVTVFQGEGTYTSDPNVHEIGSYSVPLKVPNETDGAKILVEFRMSKDGVLTVEAGGEGEERKELKINID